MNRILVAAGFSLRFLETWFIPTQAKACGYLLPRRKPWPE